ncbi:hypothetical protein NHX12_020288 [Muraenolepis orangiensis]|uniref:Uncharacterized protein n=1 Tax=Muraenolepis orangiensis TaxID=630683 RepID=A0A9Q0IUX0_9TELE|nr:hypothetical protein NHX12_020288 [Muraenolepis orangiensis]
MMWGTELRLSDETSRALDQVRRASQLSVGPGEESISAERWTRTEGLEDGEIRPEDQPDKRLWERWRIHNQLRDHRPGGDQEETIDQETIDQENIDQEETRRRP